MANKDYNFQYTPLTGRLPGNSFVKQTEQAINELAEIVNEGAAQVEVITNLANQANDNSEEALEKSNEALETAGRVYITLPNLDDADEYFDSQLYYFANSYSHNLPVQNTGFLEVKTNDTKTACEQVFIADTTGLMYMRHGDITSTEVGDETVYSVTWETWSSALASEDYVQQEVNTGVNAANSYTDDKVSGYLPLSGGTMTGEIIATTNSAIKRSVDNSYLGLAGGEDASHSAYLALSGKNAGAAAGIFELYARNDSNSKVLIGKPDGTLTWGGDNLLTDETVGTVVSSSKTSSTSVTANTATEVTHISLTAGVWVVTGIIYITAANVTADKTYGVSISTGSASFSWQSNSSCVMTASTSVNIKHAFTRIITLSATTNVYLCAYGNVATAVSSGYIDAVRIK